MSIKSNLRNKMILVLFLTMLFLMSFKITVKAVEWDSTSPTTKYTVFTGYTSNAAAPLKGGTIQNFYVYKVDSSGKTSKLSTSYKNGVTSVDNLDLSIQTTGGATKYIIKVGKNCKSGTYRIEMHYSVKKDSLSSKKYMHNIELKVVKQGSLDVAVDGVGRKVYKSDTAGYVTLPKAIPTRNGYKFKYYEIYAQGKLTGKKYNPGNKVYVGEKYVYMKAIWDEIKIENITVNPTSKTLYINETQTIKATITPQNAAVKTVTWSSNTPDIATVDSNGKVTAKKEGTAIITVKSNRTNKTAQCTITVKQKSNKKSNEKSNKKTLSSISMVTNPTKTEYYLNETLNTSGLKIQLKYSDGTTENKTSGFTCSPTTLKNKGSQKITVTYNGKTTSFNVTVKEKNIVDKTNIYTTKLNKGNILKIKNGYSWWTYSKHTNADIESGTKYLALTSNDQVEILEIDGNWLKVKISSLSSATSKKNFKVEDIYYIYYGSTASKYWTIIK